jgi:hypothetical protein
VFLGARPAPGGELLGSLAAWRHRTRVASTRCTASLFIQGLAMRAGFDFLTGEDMNGKRVLIRTAAIRCVRERTDHPFGIGKPCVELAIGDDPDAVLFLSTSFDEISATLAEAFASEPQPGRQRKRG